MMQKEMSVPCGTDFLQPPTCAIPIATSYVDAHGRLAGPLSNTAADRAGERWRDPPRSIPSFPLTFGPTRIVIPLARYRCIWNPVCLPIFFSVIQAEPESDYASAG